MQLIAFVAAIAAIVPTTFAALTINTPPSVVECEPTQLSWSGGVAPYYLSIIPDGQVSATPYEQFPPQNGTSLTWNVDLQAGLNVDLALKDSTGATAYSSRITIQSGSNTNCVSTTVHASATGSSGGSSTGSSGSTTAAGTTTPAASATGATSAGSSGSSTTSASGSSSTTTSGAGRLGVSTTLGVAGIMGLVGAALF